MKKISFVILSGLLIVLFGLGLWVVPGQGQTSDALASGVRFSAAYDQETGDISGLAVLDKDGDGLHGPGEVGLAGVTVIAPNVHQYFVPFDDRNLIAMFRASNACQGQQGTSPVVNILTSGVSIAATSNGTVYYYDHWEDGYDPDPLHPQPGSTTITGTLYAGQTRLFSNDIDTRLVGSVPPVYFDGRDRITIIGEDAMVMRYAYPSLADSVIGSRFAGAWNMEETAHWGTAYLIPAGEEWGPRTDFEFTGGSFMAMQNNTQVYLNGVLTATLNMGETFFMNGVGNGPARGGLNSGDLFTATAPIMGDLFASLCNLTLADGPWSGDSYTLEPVAHWSSEYWSPVPSRVSGPNCLNSASTDIFVYNDNPVTITVTVDDGIPTNILLPPRRSSSVRTLLVRSLSNTNAVHLYAPGGERFWGVVNFDTRNSNFEWSFSLMHDPSSRVILPWAPGNSGVPPTLQTPNPNGNMAWVTPLADTVVFVDLNGDGVPDNIDCNGNGTATDPNVDGICNEPRSSQGITLTVGQVLRVGNPVNDDLSGALIYTRNYNEKITVAWGADSCVATSGLPYLDLGYTVLPLTSLPGISIVKYTNGQVASDPNGADVPQIKPGDPVTWTYVVTNTGSVSISRTLVSVTDDQAGVTPIFDKELSGNGDTVFNPGEVWQYKATGIAVNLLIPPAGVKVVQGVCTHNRTQPPRTAYVNNGAATIPGASSNAQSHYCNPPGISIVKYTNGQVAGDPNGADVPQIKPGDPVTWTYVVTNTGSVPVSRTLVSVTDDQTGVTPIFDKELSGNGDTVFNPGEVWQYKATGIAVNLFAPPAGVKVTQGVCTHNGTQPPRTAYVNNGTATIPGASSTAQSHYCNPHVYKVYLPFGAYEKPWQVAIGFEDLPEIGSNDFDYNDWLVDVNPTVIHDPIDQNRVSELTFHFLPHARGGLYVHTFHMLFPANIFSSDATAVLTTYDQNNNVLSIQTIPFTAARANDIVIFPNTAQVFPGELVNVLVGVPFVPPQRTAELSIQFARSITFNIGDYDPGFAHQHGEGLFFDPYLHVRDTGEDIHTGDVRILTVPNTDYLWPWEGIRIDWTYPKVSFKPGSPPTVTFPPNWWLTFNKQCLWKYPYDGVPCNPPVASLAVIPSPIPPSSIPLFSLP